MTFQFVRPIRAHTMGPALYGLHGAGCGCSACLHGAGCGCSACGDTYMPCSRRADGAFVLSRPQPARAAGLGSGMIANYLYSETEAAKTLAKDYSTACLVTGVAAGGVAGLLGAVLKKPLLGFAAGALTGFLVYQTQRPPAP